MQLRRMVKANNCASSFTIAKTEVLDVKILARLSWKAKIIDQKQSPTTREVNTETSEANLAPFELPAPISLATLTLCSVNTTKLK